MFLGEIIFKYRTESNLSQRDFAKKAGFSHSYVAMLEKNIDARTGKPISPTFETIKNVSKAINISIDDILKMLDDEQEFIINKKLPKIDELGNPVIEIPILGIVKAGYDYLAQENWIGKIDVDKKLADGNELFALKVKGDSMSPVLIEDDIVIVKKQDDFENGDIVVALINGDESTIKKGKKNENSILLQPLNTNYEPLIFTKEEMESIPVTIIGIVKQLKREF